MNNKRKIFVVGFISIVILFLVLTIYFGNYKKNRNLYFTFEISNLSNYISNNIPDYSPNKYSTEILRGNNNIVYGNILDCTSADSILFETIALFTYDVENDRFDYYEINDNVRVADFLISDEKFYIVKLFHIENRYGWKFEESDLSLNNMKEIDSGEIQNLFNYPRLQYLNSDDFIIATINDDSNTMEENYKIISFIKGFSNILDESIGRLDEDVGNLLYNIDNIDVSYDGKIYYTVVDEKHCQFLKSYDIKLSSEEIIYKNCDESKIIYNYKWTPRGIYIQIVDNQMDKQAETIFLQKNNSEYMLLFQLKSNMNTFDEVLDDSKILFHNESNKWKLLDIDEYNFLDIENVELDLYPKYVELSDGKIFVKDFSDNFYMGILRQ